MYNGVYPAYIRPYTQVKQKTIKRTGEEEQQQQSTGSSASREEMENRSRNTGAVSSYRLPGYKSYQPQIQTARKNISETKQAQNPNAQTINIAQIVTDFRGTANAVGAPKEVTDEVYAYLDLIQTQSTKDIPNQKIIQSNLRNASQVLDGYISKTLKTQSNVVENWVDALFLQKIDYKSDPTAINETFKLNLGEEEDKPTINQTSQIKEAVSVQQKEAEKVSTRNYVPNDEKMKNLFINAKKSISTKDTKNALISLKKALNYAQETDDTRMQSMIYFETADLYNKNGHYTQALKGYKIAADLATDENLIAKSYMKTGKIYDEAGLIEPARNHWISAIGYAGESENIPLQVKALGNLANIQSEFYDKKTAYAFTNLANSLAEETNDNKVKGYSYKKSSQISEYLEDDSKALQYLKLSTKAYTVAKEDKKVIDNYISAADIMMNVGNSTKARALLNKAFLTAIESDNTDILTTISNKIAKIAA